MIPRLDSARRRFRLAVVIVLLMAPVRSVAEEPRAHDEGWVAPSKASTKANPLANDPGAVGGGEKLFQQRCASCHGPDGRGTSKAPDLTHAIVQAQSDGALYWKIGSGNSRQGMPSFSFLPPLQRWQLVLHLRATPLKRGEEP